MSYSAFHDTNRHTMNAIRIYCCIVLMLGMFCEQAIAQQSRIDSLKRRVEAMRVQHNDTATVLALNDLAYSFWTSNSAQGITSAQEAIRLADSARFLSGKALALCTLGWCYYNQSQFVQAMESYLQGQAIAESIDNKTLLGRILEFKGILYRFLYKYPERALKEHLQALNLLKNSRDTTFLVELWEDIAIDYTLMKQPTEALVYFEKTLPYFRATADTANLVVSYSYMGDCYLLQGEYYRSLSTHEFALAMAERGGFFRPISFNKSRIARLYNRLGEPKKAVPIALSALEFARKAHSEGPQMEAYRELANSYKQLGRYAEALQYQELLIALEDSVFQERTRSSTLVQQVDFDVQKKEAQIQLLTKDSERRTIIGVGLGGVSVVLVLAAVLLYRNNRRVVEANHQLHQVNQELDTALQDVKETQTQLVQSERMSAVGMLTAGVMHEINNPNAAIAAALEELHHNNRNVQDFFFSLLPEEGKDSPEVQTFQNFMTKAEQFIGLAQTGSSRIQRIVTTLQNYTKHQEQGKKRSSLMHELNNTLEIFRYRFRDIAVEAEFDPNVQVEANFADINQVFLSLLVNAAQANATRIIVHSDNDENSHLRITITDNGKGMSRETCERAFEPFYTTKGVAHSGLGLSIVKKIVEAMNGRVWCESELRKGATFIVELPQSSKDGIVNKGKALFPTNG